MYLYSWSGTSGTMRISLYGHVNYHLLMLKMSHAIWKINAELFLAWIVCCCRLQVVQVILRKFTRFFILVFVHRFSRTFTFELVSNV